MRLFEEPIIEVEKFDVEDVITTSGGPGPGYVSNTTPFMPF